MRHISLAVVLLVIMSTSAFARNISNEQAEAASARDAVGDTMSKLSEVQQRIKSQEALIAKEQEQLKQYQAEKTRLEQTLESQKAVFEQKSKLLDDAWKQRNDY